MRAHLPACISIDALFSVEGRSPTIDPTAFSRPTATFDRRRARRSGCFGVVRTRSAGRLRPDHHREGATSDGSVLHSPPGLPTDGRPCATIAHRLRDSRLTSARRRCSQPRHVLRVRSSDARLARRTRWCIADADPRQVFVTRSPPPEVRGRSRDGAEMWGERQPAPTLTSPVPLPRRWSSCPTP